MLFYVVEFRFSKLKTHFFKKYFFQLQHFFWTYGYLFELIFALLTFVDKGVRVLARLFQRSKILWCVQNFQQVKNFIFPNDETYFTQFMNKFFKFEEMEYLIHHIKVEVWLALCKLLILFSAVKFKLRRSFCQFVYRFKI